MFGRARLQLTAWYAGALAMILLAAGGIAYVFVARSLDDEINHSLNRTTIQLVHAGQLVVPPRPAGLPDRNEHDGDNDDEVLRGELVASDVFYAITTPAGEILSNPRRVNLEGIDFAALSTGASAGGQRTEVRVGGHRYRIASLPLAGGQVIHIGRSLDARDHQLTTLTWVLAIGGLAGVALSAAGGFWLAGRTLGPIRRSMETQRRFISDASHELRTPVAVIRANNELLLRHPAQSIGQNQDAVEAINHEAEHMTRLIEDLLTLARADEGRLSIQREEFDLAELLGDLARDLGPVAEAHGVTLTTGLPTTPTDADRQRVRQAATILLDNALKYTPKGGSVRLTCGRAGRAAEFRVSDTGPGIAAEDHRRIFDRFARVGQARARSDGGTGLGLAIARTIAEAHGGTIAVESSPENGATFIVRLPGADRQ